MARVIKVTYKDHECFQVEEDTPISEIAKRVQKYYNFPILTAMMNNEVVGLDCPINHKCTVDFFDRSSSAGNVVYAHGVYMMMIVAVKRLFGPLADVLIDNSIDNGVACELLVDGVKLDKTILKKIGNEMKKLVKEDLAFTQLSVRRMDAIKYFKKVKRIDALNSLKYIPASFIRLYRLDEYYDFYFSLMANSTSELEDFSLTYVSNNSFVVSVPTTDTPECVLPYRHVPIVFKTFYESSKWNELIGIKNTSDLNQKVCEGKANDVIRIAELHYEEQLLDIADRIYEKKDTVKIILLAGPSSSGKTTSAKKLSYYLRAKGFGTINLSTDDYFLEKKETPLDENGQYDFEGLNALDLKLFNKQLSQLLKGEKVLAPEYNFIEGIKEFKKRWLQMKPNDIIIIEGLHCLNEQLTSAIPRKNKYKIFIGPFTQLNINNHNRIHTSDTRRLRRIVRDNRTRGYGASETLAMWYKVKQGEAKYIYPYESDADDIINSAMIYELGVLKTYVEPLLFLVSEDDPMYPEALRLINFLRNVLPIPAANVPKDSVLREFIGGSGYYN